MITFVDNGIIHNHTHFLIVVLLLAFYFYVYPMEKITSRPLQILTQYACLLCGSWLSILLITELTIIVSDIYDLEFKN